MEEGALHRCPVLANERETPARGRAVCCSAGLSHTRDRPPRSPGGAGKAGQLGAPFQSSAWRRGPCTVPPDPAWTQRCVWTGSELQGFVDWLPSGRTQTLPQAPLASRLGHLRDTALDFTCVETLMTLPGAPVGLAVKDRVEGGDLVPHGSAGRCGVRGRRLGGTRCPISSQSCLRPAQESLGVGPGQSLRSQPAWANVHFAERGGASGTRESDQRRVNGAAPLGA